MQITVKSSKCLKKGTNDYGEWALYKIIATDGKVYTTIAGEEDIENAQLIKPGSVIEPKEVTVGEDDKDGNPQYRFKKFTIVSAPPAPTTPPAGMTPELWAEKDRIERWSIETQVAFKGIVELMVAKVIEYGAPESYVAMNWAMEHFQTPKQASTPTTAPPTEPTKPKSSTTLPDTAFANVGDFYTACNKTYGLTKSIVDVEIEGVDLKTEEGRNEAWASILTIHGDKKDIFE